MLYLQHDERQVGQKLGEIPNRRMVHLRGAFAREHETLGLRMRFAITRRSTNGQTEGYQTQSCRNVVTRENNACIYSMQNVLDLETKKFKQ